ASVNLVVNSKFSPGVSLPPVDTTSHCDTASVNLVVNSKFSPGVSLPRSYHQSFLLRSPLPKRRFFLETLVFASVLSFSPRQPAGSSNNMALDGCA
ncbi:hypothetical protein, partial [Microseira sp. BLCC-F43]|uniref:hypothetical protein n=1 Tax=Microseira sp. BLCC-F43 TaxID=3153602 RepID=UPI0035B9C38E